MILWAAVQAEEPREARPAPWMLTPVLVGRVHFRSVGLSLREHHQRRSKYNRIQLHGGIGCAALHRAHTDPGLMDRKRVTSHRGRQDLRIIRGAT